MLVEDLPLPNSRPLRSLDRHTSLSLVFEQVFTDSTIESSGRLMAPRMMPKTYPQSLLTLVLAFATVAHPSPVERKTHLGVRWAPTRVLAPSSFLDVCVTVTCPLHRLTFLKTTTLSSVLLSRNRDRSTWLGSRCSRVGWAERQKFQDLCRGTALPPELRLPQLRSASGVGQNAEVPSIGESVDALPELCRMSVRHSRCDSPEHSPTTLPNCKRVRSRYFFGAPKPLWSKKCDVNFELLAARCANGFHTPKSAHGVIPTLIVAARTESWSSVTSSAFMGSSPSSTMKRPRGDELLTRPPFAHPRNGTTSLPWPLVQPMGLVALPVDWAQPIHHSGNREDHPQLGAHNRGALDCLDCFLDVGWLKSCQ